MDTFEGVIFGQGEFSNWFVDSVQEKDRLVKIYLLREHDVNQKEPSIYSFDIETIAHYQTCMWQVTFLKTISHAIPF